MSAPQAIDGPQRRYTLAEELEIDRRLQEMERLLIVLRWRLERRIATHGPGDPFVLEAALRLPEYERLADATRRDQIRRLDRLV